MKLVVAGRSTLLAGVAAGSLMVAACSSDSSDDGSAAGGAGGTGGSSAGGTSGVGGGGAAPTGGSAGSGGGATGGTGTGGSAGTGGGATGGTGTGGTAGSTGGTGGSTGGTGGSTGGTAGTGGAAGAPPDDPTSYVVPDNQAAWPSVACQTQAADLVAQMSVSEMAAHMVMPRPAAISVAQIQDLGIGSMLSGGDDPPPTGLAPQSWATWLDGFLAASRASRLGIPLLYGVDAVHGHSRALDTVVFPHNIGLGCTRDPWLVEEMGRVTAAELVATGITMTFSPTITSSFNERWGRTYESFSEDPIITGIFGAAATVGMQGPGGPGTAQHPVVACAKHFAGDGMAAEGTSVATWSRPGIFDRGDVQMPLDTILQYGVDSYRPAIQAGVGSVMVSTVAWNGEKVHGSHYAITELLKGELGFQGFVLTDWGGVTELAGTLDQQVAAAVNAGADMLMQADDWNQVRLSIEGQAGNQIPTDRIQDAVTRILQVKCQTGLFNFTRDPALLAAVGSPEHRAVAREAVRKSVVVLQNENNVLPLAKDASVWVGGTGANDMDRQCGGWTLSWQGGGGPMAGTTVRGAIANVAPVVDSMDDAAVGVVVLSEEAYAEWIGDRTVAEFAQALPAADFALLDDLRARGKPVVAIIMSGRPVPLGDLTRADAWVAVWLPGTEGDGIADVLFGDYPPTGRLSHSWPRSAEQTPINFWDAGYDPLFPIWHGLSY